jgi:hypothetical protein
VFTLRQRTGVILLNRLTVPRGVRTFVEAPIAHLAGARVVSWPHRYHRSHVARKAPRPLAVSRSAGEKRRTRLSAATGARQVARVEVDLGHPAIERDCFV